MVSPELSQILERMESGRPSVRVAATEQLVRMGPRVVPFLVRCLEAGYTVQRWREVEGPSPWPPGYRESYTVVVMTPAEVASMFLRVLKLCGEDPEGFSIDALVQASAPGMPKACRAAAVRVLARLRDERAIPGLIGALGDASSSIRRLAVEGLQALGRCTVEPLLDVAINSQDLPQRAAAILALGRPGDARVLPLLVDALEDPDRDIRRSAADALAAVGPAAVEPVLQVLASGDHPARWAAGKVLAQLGQRSLVDVVLPALSDGSPPSAGEGEPRVTQVLTLALGNADPDVRERAAAALLPLGEKELAHSVLNALEGTPDPVRALSDERAVPPLLLALRRGGEPLRRPAAHALAAMGAAASSALPALEQTASGAGHADGDLRRLCRETIRAIRNALADAPAELEAAAAPGGSGSELEAAPAPAGRGSEPEASAPPEATQSEEAHPWWHFW